MAQVQQSYERAAVHFGIEQPTQDQVAELMKVGKNTLRDFMRREGASWPPQVLGASPEIADNAENPERIRHRVRR
jgi:hypothetical protein